MKLANELEDLCKHVIRCDPFDHRAEHNGHLSIVSFTSLRVAAPSNEPLQLRSEIYADRSQISTFLDINQCGF